MNKEKEKKTIPCPFCNNPTVNRKFCDFCDRPIHEEKTPVMFTESTDRDYLGKW